MTDFLDENWKKTKKKFISGILFSAFIIFITIFFQSLKGEISEKDFVKEDHKIIETKPIFKVDYYAETSDYYVEIHFKNEKKKYIITGNEYNYLKKEEFENEINAGDTVSIFRFDNEIISISKKGKDYLNYLKSTENRKNTDIFIVLLFTPILFICIITQFFKRKPTIKINNKAYEIKFDSILIITFIITFIILKLNIDFEFIVDGNFNK